MIGGFQPNAFQHNFQVVLAPVTPQAPSSYGGVLGGMTWRKPTPVVLGEVTIRGMKASLALELLFDNPLVLGRASLANPKVGRFLARVYQLPAHTPLDISDEELVELLALIDAVERENE